MIMKREREEEFKNERGQMVQEQLIPRGITDKRVLEAFRKVARHKFLPQIHIDQAYGDYPVNIGEGQTISQPYMVALMSQCLEVKETDKVLEIGTGSGYQVAILAELVDKVYTVERFSVLSKRAQRILKDLGYANIELKVGDGSLGWKEFAPYDGIIVTCAAPSIPEPLKEQLKENGKLVIPIGGGFSQTLTVIRRQKGGLTEEDICGCVFVPLLGKYGWKRQL